MKLCEQLNIVFKMNEAKHDKLLKEAGEALGKTEKEVLDVWNAKKPHFGGNGPHRYDGSSKECTYCLRPIDWETNK